MDNPNANHDPANKTMSHVLGELTWLISQSPLHKNLFVSDLEWMVMPAILHEQFRIFYGSNKQPVGVILWATVSNETEKKLESGQIRLAPHEWKAGENPWLIEMIAPFGGQQEMLNDAASTVFAGKPFKFHRAGPSGREVHTFAASGG